MNSETKNNIKKLTVSIIGVMLVGAGVALATLPELGSDCLASFNEVVSRKLGISFGYMTTITEIIMTIIAFMMNRKNVGVGTLMAILFVRFPIDMTYQLISKPSFIIVCLLYVVIGTLMVALGVELIIHADLGMGTYEAFMYGIAEKTSIKFIYVKYICDATFLFLTLILGGFIGLGTIINYILCPKMMDIFDGLISKHLSFK